MPALETELQLSQLATLLGLWDGHTAERIRDILSDALLG